MGKIANIIESGIAGVVDTLEFCQQPSNSQIPSFSGKTGVFEPKKGFKSFVFGESRNRKYFIIAILGTFLQLVILKWLFPFPDFISDSYNYIESAALHLNVNLWPIGYAKFLWLIHLVHYSDALLVCVQYIILESALLYFFYTLLYVFRPSPLSSGILFAFLLFNPLFLYLSNCILSDALFTAVTFIWLSQLIWMIYQPKYYHIIVSAILIGIAFSIRYTAVYYPIISGVAILLSRYKKWVKYIGTLSPLAFIVPFVLFTKAETKKITGTEEFSVFGSWQIANNALYMYGHINVDPQKLPRETVTLDSMVKKYYKLIPAEYFNFEDFPGTFFIKHSDAPLKQYMIKHFRKELDEDQFKGWGKVSPIYGAYGNYLMLHYPLSFARYYMWLNTKKYFNPFLEKFGSYNVGEDSVFYPARYWFHYKSPQVKVVSKELQSNVFFVFPFIFMLLNISFVGLFIWSYILGKLKIKEGTFSKVVWLAAAFLLVNFGFSVFATPVVLRYQVISLALLFTFSLLLLEFIDKNTITEEL